MKKVLRFLLILIVILLAGYLILCVTSPAKMEVEESAVIDAPKPMVWHQLIDFSSYEHYSPWKEQDNTITSTLTGTPGQPGHKSAWTSEKSGDGEMEITSIEGNTMNYDLRFLTPPMEGEAKGIKIVEEVEDGTKVTLKYSGETKFLMRGMSTLFGKKMMHAMFKRELELLQKHIASGNAKMPGYDISEGTYPATTFAVLRKTVKMTEMESFFSNSYKELGEAAGEAINGNASAIYYSWDMENGESDCAAAFPVAAPVKGYATVNVPESKMYTLKMVGPYSQSYNAHMAMGKRMMEDGVENAQDAMVIEEYVVGPGQEADSNKYITNINYILK